MATWTSQAVADLTDYLRRVEELAQAAGDDAEEISSGLRDHIMRETEEDSGEIVTPEHLRKVLANMGTPEEVIGEQPSRHGQAAGPSTDPPVPASKTNSLVRFCGILMLIGVGLMVLFPISYLLAGAIRDWNGPGHAGIEPLPQTHPSVLTAEEEAAVAESVYETFIENHSEAPTEQIPNEYGTSILMRAISVAQKSFQAARYVDRNGDGIGDYGTLEELRNPRGDGSAPPYTPPMTVESTKDGYRFTIQIIYGTADTPPAYTCKAFPIETGASIYKQYYVDQTGVIRITLDGTAAGPTSTPMS